MERKPMTGISVVDLTNVLAGPYASYQLAILGATVTKVEVPGRGDLARRLGADEKLNEGNMGASFLAQNAGKRSVEINLKSEAGKVAFLELVRDADVLIENFRPGVLSRLGFSWEQLHEVNQGLVYCSISGFGQTGPMSTWPAYDQIIQGLSGIMSVTGTSETAPVRAGFPVCDTLGGLAAALAIVAALRERDRSGNGARLDVSMLEVAVSAMGWPFSNYLVADVVPEPMGNENATAAPSGLFPTATGALNIAANQQKQFESLCRLVGRPDLADDARFTTRLSRKQNRAALNEELSACLRLRSAQYWAELLSSNDVPAAEVLSVPEVAELDQLAIRGFFNEFSEPELDDRVFRVTGSGVLYDDEPFHAESPPPKLGAHNALLAPHLTEESA
jgi:crotonobetainyl-CoA:carnitine CoA-transferase CaiB-like acyl-CoA transferase